MCYSIYLSTTSQDDLSHLTSGFYHFLPVPEKDAPEIVNLLDHPARWRLESQYGGCSCHFRQLGEGSDLDFSPPADWCPEDSDNVEATKVVYDVLTRMLANGYEIDLIDVWPGAQPEAIKVLDVSLSKVPQDSFRFFENHKFSLRR